VPTDVLSDDEQPIFKIVKSFDR